MSNPTNPNPTDWRGSMGYLDLQNEQARQAIYEAFSNMLLMLDWFQQNAERLPEMPREIGGLDRSAALLSGVLGAQEHYHRMFHDDGCRIVPADEDLEESEGHDFGPGCELNDDPPDELDHPDESENE